MPDPNLEEATTQSTLKDPDWLFNFSLKEDVKSMLTAMTGLPSIEPIMAHRKEGLYMFSSPGAKFKDYYIWNIVVEDCYKIADPVDEGKTGLTDDSFEEKLKKMIQDQFQEIRLMPVEFKDSE